MMRYADKAVLAMAAIALAVMLIYQVVATVKDKSAVARQVEAAQSFVAKVNQNDLPPMPRSTGDWYGRVLAAWEGLPPGSAPFDRADFFPQYTPGVR